MVHHSVPRRNDTCLISYWMKRVLLCNLLEPMGDSYFSKFSVLLRLFIHVGSKACNKFDTSRFFAFMFMILRMISCCIDALVVSSWCLYAKYTQQLYQKDLIFDVWHVSFWPKCDAPGGCFSSSNLGLCHNVRALRSPSWVMLKKFGLYIQTWHCPQKSSGITILLGHHSKKYEKVQEQIEILVDMKMDKVEGMNTLNLVP